MVKKTVTTQIAVAVFLLVVFMSISAALWQNPETYDVSRIHTFMVVFVALGTIITFLFYYSLVEIQEQTQRLTLVHELRNVNINIHDKLYPNILRSSKIIPRFIISLYPLVNWNKVCKHETTENSHTEDTVECIMEKYTISNYIFMIWQDVIRTSEYTSYDMGGYITQFLEYASSKQLYDIWVIVKINYDCHTQIFGDLLFEYVCEYQPKTLHDYTNIAKLLVKDKRYTDIVNECCGK